MLRFRRLVTTAALIVLAALVLGLGAAWWTQRQWFAVQKQQLATIQRLEAFPPAGWDRDAWRNALVTVHNVWGNVTYTPGYSKLSVAEMRGLQTRLDLILAGTTPDNSADSVDRVFELLLEHGRKADFIAGYREEFRDFHASVRRRVQAAIDANVANPEAEPD